MRMLNSSAVLNGQPAILAWSVTSIQLPPETIQACPINQPIRYPQSQLRSLSSPFPHSISFTFRPVSHVLHPFVPQRETRCLSPSSSCGPHPTFRLLLNPWSSFLADCPFQPRPPTDPPLPLSPSRYQPTPSHLHANPLRPVSTFFFPPSRICAWGLVCSMKVLPDGARRATYIIVKHTMRATAGLALGVSEMPPRLRARIFFFSVVRREPRRSSTSPRSSNSLFESKHSAY